MSGRIVVTGAAGFVGTRLVTELRERGLEPVPVVRPGGRGVLGGRPIPLTDEAALREACAGADAVVHLAARAHVLKETGDPTAAFRSANVDGALSVARAAAASGVRRFVFASSAGVLGNRSPPGGFDDDSPPAPHDAYTRSKLEAERELAALAGTVGLELVVVRPPVVYGPGAPGNFGRLLRLVGRVPLPFGAVETCRTGVGLRNLADFLIRAATLPAYTGLTCLAADDESPSIAELCRRIAHLRRRPARLVPVPPALLVAVLRLAGSGGDVARLTNPFVLRASRAARVGWTPPYSLDEELAHAVRGVEP